MALEDGIPNFWTWLLGDPVKASLFRPDSWGFLPGTIAICFILLLLVPFFCFVVASFKYGPSEAFYYVARAMFSAVTEDLPRFSPRRTFAVARLAVQEAIRNRVLYGFGVFIVLLLFAGLFLDVSNSNPARVYLSFVLHTTNYLVLLMALFLSTFSIPNDIKNRTIYTVVTKPVRASEIVLGRILGFAAVGTAMLLAMGLIGYGFVWRGLAHSHRVDLESIVEEKDDNGKLVRITGQTTLDSHHRHTFELDATGKGKTDVVAHHWHAIQGRNLPHFFELVDLDRDVKLSREELQPPPEPDPQESENVRLIAAKRRELLAQIDLDFASADKDKDGFITKEEFPAPSYRVGPPEGQLVAKAPVYGALQIFDRNGNPAEKGINVGNEWEYRGYIEGGTPGVQSRAAAVWTFSDITPEKYPEGLPLEMTIRVFRSYKGDIKRGVLGEIVVCNPNRSAKVKRSGPILFESKEFVSDYKFINRTLRSEIGGSGGAGTIDLFDDLVDNGQVQIEIRCVDAAQYFGVAAPDLYLRPADAAFEWNFVKAYLSIWLQMLLVTGFGVTFSTFLTGSVAMMATLSAIVLGFFGQFVRDVASGAMMGGGPIESLIRIITQQNVMNELEVGGIVARVLKSIDWVLMGLMTAGTYILPDYTQFDTATFVADGYNIFGDLVAQQIVMAAVYFVLVTIVGYFFLKTREIAA
ncbi:MAG TPA: ABC transporter permease [Pirellulaceae bacterium]|nr:ABC transporter permease [Pirellulaceae bacterium]